MFIYIFSLEMMFLTRTHQSNENVSIYIIYFIVFLFVEVMTRVAPLDEIV